MYFFKKMVNDLERKFNEGQSEQGSAMNRIIDETKRNTCTMKEWLTPVIWDKDEKDTSQDDTCDDDSSDNNGTNEEDNDQQ